VWLLDLELLIGRVLAKRSTKDRSIVLYSTDQADILLKSSIRNPNGVHLTQINFHSNELKTDNQNCDFQECFTKNCSTTLKCIQSFFRINHNHQNYQNKTLT
jgi:hypothetical protein